MLELTKSESTNFSERLWQASQKIREIQEIIDLNDSNSS